MAHVANARADTQRVARSARKRLVPVLGTLQRATTPGEIASAATAVAQALGHLRDFERGDSRALESALAALRGALDVMQAGPTAFESVTSQLAEALWLVHSLNEQLPPKTRELESTTLLDLTQRSAGQSEPPLSKRPTRVDERPSRGRPLAEFVYGVATDGAPKSGDGRAAPKIDVVLARHSASNFYAGFDDGDSSEHCGLFIASDQLLDVGEPVRVHVNLPGGHVFDAWGVVRWQRALRADITRDPLAPPGYGVKFTRISDSARQLIRRFTRSRPPLFFQS